MGIICRTFQDPRVFRDLCFPFLLKNEAIHCLGIGIINTLVDQPQVYPRFHLAAFFDDSGSMSQLVGVAWITHPHPLGASLMPMACLPALVRFAQSVKPTLTGIAAPFDIAEAFKESWTTLKRCRIQTRFAQGIYEVQTLVMPPEVEGSMRLVREADKDWLKDWCWRFVVDCGMATGPDNGNGLQYAKQAIEGKGRYIWEVDGKPVSMTGVQGPTPRGIRVSWVYTPAEHRGKGYAAWLVAKVCEEMFKNGKDLCFLYTDLANPTSNNIYQKIGFRQLSKPLHYTFDYESRI